MFEINPFRKISSLMLALVLVLAAACAGEDGELGPKGDKGDTGNSGTNGNNGADGTDGTDGADGADGADGEDAVVKLGFFQGTIAGHRQDGTAFSEAFNFEYVYGHDQALEEEWLFQRFETPSAAIVNQLKTNGAAEPINANLDNGYVKLTTEPSATGNLKHKVFFLSFSKGLNNTQIFRLNANAYFEERNYNKVLEISPAHNAIYKFITKTEGELDVSTIDTDNDGVDDANMVSKRFSQFADYRFFYDMNSGELKYIQKSGLPVEDEDLLDKYDNVKFVMNDDLKTFVMVNAANDAPLYDEVGVLPADELSITNYKNESGVVSFDFTITISKYRGFLGHRDGFAPPVIDGLNTTAHDLTITGKFSTGGKFYTESVGRKQG